MAIAVAVGLVVALVLPSRSGGESFPTAFARYPSRMEYLPNTHAYNESRELIATEVTRELLRRMQDDESSYLRFLGDAATMLPPAPEAMSLTPTAYGRIYRGTVPGSERELLFLKYSLVFPLSGLPARISAWKRAAARLVGNPVDWHQLDIHGSIYVVLDA
jgi:hypothetical protein